MMITEQQAIELVRLVCELLAALGCAAGMVVGIWRLACPFGRRVRIRLPILYFLQSGRGKTACQYPVVNCGTAAKPCPAAVRSGRRCWTEQVGELLEVAVRRGHPEDIQAISSRRPWFACVMLILAGLTGAALFGALFMSGIR